MSSKAATLHLEIIAAARRRQAAKQEIRGLEEFETFMKTLEAFGRVAERSEEDGLPAELFASACLFYGRCVDHAARGVEPAPEADSVFAKAPNGS